MGIEAESDYYDRKSNLTPEEYARTLATSTTLYIGNLGYYIFESQVNSFFGLMAGQALARVVMGINRKT